MSDISALPILTAAEWDLLQWLGQEEFSQYGECYGDHLDSLIAKGLAQRHPNTGRDNSFIAKGNGKMYDKVSLTEPGRAALEARKNGQ
jgi:hypothetical protein